MKISTLILAHVTFLVATSETVAATETEKNKMLKGKNNGKKATKDPKSPKGTKAPKGDKKGKGGKKTKADVCFFEFKTKSVDPEDLLDPSFGSESLPGPCNSLCDLLCDDGNFCTVDDSPACDEHGCTPLSERPATDCSDGIDCTDDSCDPEAGCFNAPNDSNCDSPPSECFLGTCDLDFGGCVYRPVQSLCESNELCTLTAGCVVLDNLIQTVGGQGSDDEGNPSNEGPEEAFDGDEDTKWLVFEESASLDYEFSIAQEVLSYTVTSANDSPARDPQDWILQGSNDDSNYVDLDRQTGIDFEGRFTTLTFTVASPGTYKHYRFNVQRNSGAEILQLAELTFFGFTVLN